MKLEQLDFTTIAIPDDSDVKASTRWICSVFPGVSIYIENLIENEIASPVSESHDGQSGMKYGILLYHSALYEYVKECGIKIEWNSRWNQLLFLAISAHFGNEEALHETLPISTSLASFNNGSIYGCYRYSRAYFWTTDRNEYPKLLAAVSQLVRDRASDFILKGTEIPAINTVAIKAHYVYGEREFDDKKGMLLAIRSELMANEAEKAFVDAFKVFSKKYAEHRNIGFIVDPEQSAFLFTLGNLKNDECTVFHRHKSDLIAKWISLEKDFESVPYLHICDWLIWAVKRCLRKKPLKDMPNQRMLAMFGTDKSTIFWVFELNEARKGLYSLFHYILSRDQIINLDEKQWLAIKEDAYAFSAADLWSLGRREAGYKLESPVKELKD